LSSVAASMTEAFSSDSSLLSLKAAL
jgi:hypothetical protein